MAQGVEQSQKKGLIGQFVFNIFGRPKGPLGRIGGWFMARSNMKMDEWVIARLGVRPADHVLEIGFGPGVAIELLSQRAVNGFVAGVDYSEEMIEMAEERNQEAIAAGKVELYRAKVEALPFEDGRFDKVLAIKSLAVWDDPAAGLKEIARILKPGGLVALGFTTNARKQISQDEIDATLETAGFKHLRREKHGSHICLLAET
jgi:SAM-dependent methyltransferase